MATHRTSATKNSAWPVYAHRYCTKGGSTVPLIDDAKAIHGFDMSRTQCRTTCEESVDCKFYSHGHWNKGLWPPAGFRGKVRCQTYSKCELKEIEGMHVFEKPSAATPVIAAVAVLAIVNALVLQSDFIGIQGGIPCTIAGWAVSWWLVDEAGSKASWDFQNIMFVSLAVFHALNCLGLMGVVTAAKCEQQKQEQAEHAAVMAQEEFEAVLAQRNAPEEFEER